MKLYQIILAIIFIIFDYFIDKCNIVGKWINKKLHLEKIEVFLTNCNKYIALLSIFLGILIITPINVLATICLIHGLILEFIILELIGKVLTMVIVVRIFNLTKDRLLTFKLINLLYCKYQILLNKAKEIIKLFKQTIFYQNILSIKQKIITIRNSIRKQFL